jgi:long-subunit fatty acid transport protein
MVINQDENSDNLTSFIRESLLIGIGAQYRLQDNLKLFGGLNFNNGFTDVLKKGPYNTNDPKVISNFVELNIGLFF